MATGQQVHRSQVCATSTGEGITPLHRLAKKHYLHRYSSQRDLFYIDAFKLHLSAAKGDDDDADFYEATILGSLDRKGARQLEESLSEVNATDRFGNTPLHYAVCTHPNLVHEWQGITSTLKI